MTDKPNNPKAFPYPKDTYRTMGGDWHGYPGMTLRDYFAAKAMAVLLDSIVDEDDALNVPKASYAIADAMLEERGDG